MQRSGTTLLGRLLGAHPEIALLSQPFPLVLHDAMRAFRVVRGLEVVHYPLGPLFGDPGYTGEDLEEFLASHRPGPEALRTAFDRMRGWSGQRTEIPEPVVEMALEELPENGGLAALTAHLAHRVSAGVLGEGKRIRGAKEIQCEELLPHFLAHGVRCLLIVRDPRDVVTSLNHGRGAEYSGRIKPTLFNVRNWRKSVAFAFELESEPGFAWLRYEDLVGRPGEALDRLAAWLGVEAFPTKVVEEGPATSSGEPWRGNSSHGVRRGVSRASVGNWRRHLRPAVSEAVEAACLPELEALGYPVGIDRAGALERLRSFREPYEETRPELAAYRAPERSAEEAERLLRLLDPPGPDSRRWFLFEGVHRRLQRTGEETS